jgi:hypothetical protein
MAHFAELNNDNVVIRVLVVRNEDILDSNGDESEDVGVSYCQALFSGNWVQTSYNHNIRRKYAEIGGYYDESANVFISYNPYPSWILNENSDWEAPHSAPSDDNHYRWDESTVDWEQIPYDELPPALQS